ncbi:hypothetical protein NQ314_001058 [Rhamnusium bicolor]|uniref:Uncharacterized protein n=1 Tax=Rhamnusium bicolor TaxID=1586634 RepID=A0AAV8ZSR5_9CUCU|nr:hypothetical protein NQ314_001058 [Rhamnusium bicolor]
MSVGTADVEDVDSGTITGGDWRHDNELVELQPTTYRNATDAAKDCRDTYRDYFIGNGKVPWQDRFI